MIWDVMADSVLFMGVSSVVGTAVVRVGAVTLQPSVRS